MLFREIIARHRIRPRAYRDVVHAMQAVDLLETVEQLGDQVLKMARDRAHQHELCKALLLDLVRCFEDPLENSGRIGEIEKEVKERLR